MEWTDRFTPLMSRALHYAGSPQGLAAPLADIHTILCTMAEEERDADRHGSACLSAVGQPEDMRLCRFAVYAWVDEILLNSARPDAASWMGMSLQSRYFETSAAGREVFVALRQRLDAVSLSNADALSPLHVALPVSGTERSPDEEQGMVLAVDLERAAAQPLSVSDCAFLRVYALCLLYGFCGRFFMYPEVLRRLRASARRFLRATVTPPKDASSAPPPVSLFYRLEPVLYVVVPLFAVTAFALYCADILANIPLNVFSL